MLDKTGLRLLEFSNFLKDLPEERFDITTWFDGKHECGTVGCIAGHAVLNYAPYDKLQPMLAVYRLYKAEKMRIDNSILAKMGFGRKYNLDLLNEMYQNVLHQEPAWAELGAEILGFNMYTASELFLPASMFWQGVTQINRFDLARHNTVFMERTVTKEWAVAALRMLAFRPSHSIEPMEVFNLDRALAEADQRFDEWMRERRIKATVADIVEKAHQMPSASDVMPVNVETV